MGGWRREVNVFKQVHRIAWANPGPIPVDVQTALFYASRDKQQEEETSYFARLSDSSKTLIEKWLFFPMFFLAYGLAEYLLAAFGGDICETHLDFALAYFVCLVVWCCLRCCKVVPAAGW